MLEHLKNLAEGVRGSEGTITLSNHVYHCLQTILHDTDYRVTGEELPNGAYRVDCQELVDALDSYDSPQKDESMPEEKLVAEDYPPPRKSRRRTR